MSYGKLTSGKKQVKGRTQSTEATFASIPGLKQWIDPAVGAKIDSSNRISKIIDLSGNGNDIAQSNASLMPTLVTSGGYSSMQFTSDNGMSTPDLTKFKFLHNGSPHGVYLIYRPNASNENIRGPILWTGDSVVQPCYVLAWDDRTSVPREDRITKIIGRPVSAYVNNVGADNFVEIASTAFIRDIFYGAVSGNDSIIYRNSSGSSFSTAESSGAASSADQQKALTYGGRNHSGFGFSYFNLWLALIYDWTGISTADINTFDTMVMELAYEQYSGLLTI